MNRTTTHEIKRVHAFTLISDNLTQKYAKQIGATYIPLITKITENANKCAYFSLTASFGVKSKVLPQHELRMPLAYIYAFCLFARRDVAKSALA